jgi:hypothetical protein
VGKRTSSYEGLIRVASLRRRVALILSTFLCLGILAVVANATASPALSTVRLSPALPDQPPPNYQDGPSAISCPTSGSCIAVGDYAEQSELSYFLPVSYYGVYAEIFSNGGWASEALPIPADASHAELDSISCTSASWCVAVGAAPAEENGLSGTQQGSFLIEVFSNGTWTPTEIPVVGAQAPNLTSVSCWAPSACVAMGLGSDGSVVEILQNGTWSQAAFPAPPGSATQIEVDKVDCWAITQCVALGTYVNSVQALFFADELDGATWSPTNLTLPAGWNVGNEVSEVALSCISPVTCEALLPVQDPQTGATPAIATEALSNGQWTGGFLPQPAAQAPQLSCWAPQACVSLASYRGGNGNTAVTGFQLSNGSWSPTSFPSLADSVNSTIGPVSCTSDGSCTATGTYSISSNPVTFAPSAFNLDGDSWSRTVLPIVDYGPEALLSGVSCANGQSCMAVGTTYDTPGQANGFQVPMAESLADGAWNGATLPLAPSLVPGGDGIDSYQPAEAVSCPSTAFCIAVGIGFHYIRTGFTVRWPLLESFMHGSWASEILPLPGDLKGIDTFMTGVSCPTTSFCVAVGFNSSGGVGKGGLVESLVDQAWHPHPLFKGGALSAVSCAAVGFCVAVGNDSKSQGVALTLTGGVWTQKALPVPLNGDGQSDLTAVSCASRSFCVVAGNYVGSAGTPEPFVDVFSKGTWHSENLPLSGGSDEDTQFNGIACVSANYCVVVGSSDGLPFVETMANAVWTPAAVSLAPGDTSESLNSVSCPSLSACVAAGIGAGPSGTYPIVATIGN